MPDQIQPALTPEEWAQLAESGGGVAESVHRYFSGSFIGIHIGEPQLMALANAALPDDDLRKITREDIARVREVINDARIAGNLNPNNQSDAGWERHQKRIDAALAVAAKLAALLPP